MLKPYISIIVMIALTGCYRRPTGCQFDKMVMQTDSVNLIYPAQTTAISDCFHHLPPNKKGYNVIEGDSTASYLKLIYYQMPALPEVKTPAQVFNVTLKFKNQYFRYGADSKFYEDISKREKPDTLQFVVGFREDKKMVITFSKSRK